MPITGEQLYNFIINNEKYILDITFAGKNSIEQISRSRANEYLFRPIFAPSSSTSSRRYTSQQLRFMMSMLFQIPFDALANNNVYKTIMDNSGFWSDADMFDYLMLAHLMFAFSAAKVISKAKLARAKLSAGKFPGNTLPIKLHNAIIVLLLSTNL